MFCFTCPQVWTWGKGDYYRLGLDSDAHMRWPTLVEALRSERVVQVAVGALHCLAVTEQSQVFAWGDNDHGQQASGSTLVNRKPALVQGLGDVRVKRVACGSSHSLAWSTAEPLPPGLQEPVLFDTTRDPLGSSALGVVEPDAVEADAANSAPLPHPPSAAPPAPGPASPAARPSLSQILLGLESTVARQHALNHVLAALKILQAREALTAAFNCSVDSVATAALTASGIYLYIPVYRLESVQASVQASVLYRWLFLWCAILINTVCFCRGCRDIRGGGLVREPRGQHGGHAGGRGDGGDGGGHHRAGDRPGRRRGARTHAGGHGGGECHNLSMR